MSGCIKRASICTSQMATKHIELLRTNLRVKKRIKEQDGD